MQTTTTKKSITSSERLQLMGLLALGKRYTDQLEELARVATEITGEDRQGFGHAADAVFEHHDIDRLMRKLEMTVVEEVKEEMVPA